MSYFEAPHSAEAGSLKYKVVTKQRQLQQVGIKICFRPIKVLRLVFAKLQLYILKNRPFTSESIIIKNPHIFEAVCYVALICRNSIEGNVVEYGVELRC